MPARISSAITQKAPRRRSRARIPNGLTISKNRKRTNASAAKSQWPAGHTMSGIQTPTISSTTTREGSSPQKRLQLVGSPCTQAGEDHSGSKRDPRQRDSVEPERCPHPQQGGNEGSHGARAPRPEATTKARGYQGRNKGYMSNHECKSTDYKNNVKAI